MGTARMKLERRDTIDIITLDRTERQNSLNPEFPNP